MSAFGGIADINPQRTAHNSASPYIDPNPQYPSLSKCAVVRCALWFGTHVSKTLRVDGRPVGRYRSLMTVCEGEELKQLIAG